MSIKKRIILLFLLVALTPYAIIALFIYIDVRTNIENIALDRINTLATLQKARTLELLERYDNELNLFENRIQLKRDLAQYNATHAATARDAVAENIQAAVTDGKNITSIHILSLNGDVIVSTDPALRGLNCSSEEYFTLGKDSNITSVLKKKEGKVYFELAGPLTFDNVKIGVIVIEVPADDLFELFADKTGLGKTGYWSIWKALPNSDLVAIIPGSGNVASSSLTLIIERSKQPLVPSVQATAGVEKIFTDIRNQSGISVIAATRSIKLPSGTWGIVAAEQRTEVFAAANALASQLVFFSALLIIFVGFLSSIISQIIVRPVVELSRAAERLSRGDFTITTTSHKLNDEIGLLAQAFSTMATKLKNSYESLEDKVREKTKELEESKKGLSEYIDHMSTFNVKLDLKADFLLVNKAALLASGLPEEQLLKTNFLEGKWFTFNDNVASRSRKAFIKATQGESVVYDEQIQIAGGKIIWINFGFVPVKDMSGVVQYIIAEGRDISEQKQVQAALAESKAKDDAILASIVDGVLMLDMQGQPIYANNGAKEILGIDITDPDIAAEGVQRFNFYKPDGVTLLAKEVRPMARLLCGEKVENEEFFVSSPEYPKGKYIVLSARIVSSQNVPFGFLIVFRDITKEKEIEKAKTEFVSIASHQLRTPTTSIRWYTEMLLGEKDVGPLNVTQKKYLGEIYRNDRQMIDLVNSLLNVSRIELGTFTFQPRQIDVTKLINDILQDASMQINEKKIVIQYNPAQINVTTQTDPQLLRAALSNLITNAIEYTPQNGIVGCAVLKERDMVKIIISDTGCGIPHDEQSKIFTKFFRADNARAVKPDGNGLGLYITKSIIESLGGSIVFSSLEGTGTTFTIMLPLHDHVEEGSADK